MPRREDLPDEQRCVFVKVNDQRCGSPRRPGAGNTLCTWHEERAADRVRHWNRAEVMPEMTIEAHLSYELRATMVQLRELEFQILDLGLSTGAWFGLSGEETEARESDDPKNSYTSHKQARAAGAHPVVVQYLREREHHLSVIKLWGQLGLAARQMQLVERYVESLVNTAHQIAEALGHDPNSSATRRIVMDVLQRQQRELRDFGGDPRQITGTPA